MGLRIVPVGISPDRHRRDLVAVWRGAKERGVPLRIDTLGLHVEADGAALVVWQNDLLCGCVRGEAQRGREHQQEQQTAHAAMVGRPR